MSNQVLDKQAYEWVKTGHWSLAMFREWLSTYNSNGIDHVEAGDIVCEDRASARKFLPDIGILDQDGELHNNYGGNKKCCKGGPQWGHAWDCQSLP